MCILKMLIQVISDLNWNAELDCCLGMLWSHVPWDKGFISIVLLEACSQRFGWWFWLLHISTWMSSLIIFLSMCISPPLLIHPLFPFLFDTFLFWLHSGVSLLWKNVITFISKWAFVCRSPFHPIEIWRKIIVGDLMVMVGREGGAVNA